MNLPSSINSISRRLWAWQPRDRKTVVLCGLLAVIALWYWVSVIAVDRKFFQENPFGDFFLIWSAAKIVIMKTPYAFYDFHALNQLRDSLGQLANETLPAPYPPTYLLFIYPLGYFSYFTAYTIWILSTLVLFIFAVCVNQKQPKAIFYSLILAPTTAVSFAVGQNGFLTGALFIAGARLVRTQPIFAGILFGLLSYKPQFGILIPVAMIAARQWRVIWSACLTIICLFVVTTILFGSSIWLVWWRSIFQFSSGVYEQERISRLFIIMISSFSNARAVGLEFDAACAVQAATALFSIIVVWTCWRRPKNRLLVPILLSSAYLATPYGYTYDLPMLGAAAVLFAADRLEVRGFLTALEISSIVLILVVPIIANLPDFHPPVSASAIILLLFLMVKSTWRNELIEST